MRNIIFIFTLIVSFIFISCEEESTDKGTHNLEKPSFELSTLGNPSGYASESKPLDITFIIPEETVKGDAPYKFIWDFGDGETKESTELEERHSYKKQGIYKVKVTLQDNDYKSDEETPEEFYTEELDIIAKSKVDFAIQVAQTNKVIFAKDDEGKLTVNIVNLGSESAKEPTKLKSFLSKDQKIDDDDIEIGENTIESLTEGQTSEEFVDFIINEEVETGKYWVITKIDYDNKYIESNEGNNTSVLTSQIEVIGANELSPDLSFSDVTLPDFFIVNDPFTLNMKIANIGQTSSIPFLYKVIISENDKLEEIGDEDNDDTYLVYKYITDSILANDSLSVPVKASIIKEGEYYLFIVLDANEDIFELNEENNIYRSPEKIVVGKTLSGVDLAPSNVLVSPLTNIVKGRTLSINYSIKNRGDRPSLKSNARVFMSRNEIIDENDVILTLEDGDLGEIGTIGGDLSIENSHKVKVPEDESFETGEYYILVDINYLVDGERITEEVDYNNNVGVSRKITIEEGNNNCSKDLLIENLEVLPNPAFEGSPFTVKFDISNKGTENSTSFITKVYSAESGKEIGTESTLKKNYNISRLTADGTLNKELVLNIPNNISSDRYCVLIKADETSIVGECDEENNTINYCFDVTVRGNDNDIVTSNVSISNTNIDVIESRSENIRFTVKNVGTTNTATFYCKAYLSPDEEFSKQNDFALTESYTIYNILGGTEQEVRDYEVVIPKTMGDREYKLFVNCDDTSLVSETDETNNSSVSAETVKINKSSSGCNADDNELNDTSLTASLLNPINNISAGLCDQDIDWYYFNLNKTHKFRIDMEQGFSDKDIDIALYKKSEDGSLVEIAVSESTTKKEVIEKNILLDEDEGEYYIKIYPKNYQAMTDTSYLLNISYEEVGGPGVDLFLKDIEENIANIMTGEDFQLNFKVENLKSDDSGNFSVGIYLSEDRNISIDDKIIRIINSESLAILENRIFEETLTLTEDLPSGRFYLILKVDPYNSITESIEDNNEYVKEVLVNYQTTCELDGLEPNRWTPFSAKVITNGRYDGLKLCDEDEDVYLLYMKKDSIISVDLFFSDDVGDINMGLYKPNGETASTIASSTSYTDDESLTYTAEESGFHILKIYHGWDDPDDAQTYSMEVSGITDGYNFINNKLQIDTEYLETNENMFVNIEVESESTRNSTRDIDYKIYISNDPIIDENDEVIYHEVISSLNIGEKINKRVKTILPPNLNTANYYFISKIDAGNTVTELNENDNVKITVATVAGVCQGDRFESNNSTTEAEENGSSINLATGLYENLTICPSDKDYYVLPLPVGTNLFVNLYFDNNIGDLDLRIEDSQGYTVADSSSITSNETINFPIVNAGVYYVRVAGAERNNTNAYSLEILNPSCDGVNCNNGACVLTNIGKVTCECEAGYNGDVCDVCDDGYHDVNGECIIDETCESHPCEEAFKTTCNVVAGLVECSCDNGYNDVDGSCTINCESDLNSTANPENTACICVSGYHDVDGLCTIDETCEVDSCTEENKTTCNIVGGLVECSCDDGYHDVAGVCTIDETCEVDSCTEANETVCNIVAGLVECSCDADFHDENDVCTSNTKSVECTDNTTANATSTVVNVDVNWVNDAWEVAVDCVWTCNPDFHNESDLCVANTKQVSCTAITAPENASQVDAQVDVTWENDAWTAAADCTWTCDTGFTLYDGACVPE